MSPEIKREKFHSSCQQHSELHDRNEEPSLSLYKRNKIKDLRGSTDVMGFHLRDPNEQNNKILQPNKSFLIKNIWQLKVSWIILFFYGWLSFYSTKMRFLNASNYSRYLAFSWSICKHSPRYKCTNDQNTDPVMLAMH